MISFFGPNLAIWRQSSDPIEPPPPVTMTTSSLRYPDISSMFRLTSSRPSKSSMLTSRIFFTLTSPSMSSSTLGNVLSLHFVSLLMRSSSAISLLDADGIATMISSILYRFATSFILSLPATTGTPLMVVPCFVLSSSTITTGTIFMSAWFFNSLISIEPALPAPMIMTLLELHRFLSIRVLSRRTHR